MSHSSRRGSVTRKAHHPFTTRRLKQAGRHALEALESRIAPSTVVTLSAGTLGVLGDAGGGGEDESLVFTVAGGALRISDPGHAIVAGLGTVQDGAHAVLAPLASLTDAVHVFTGGGHDSVAIEGAMPAVHAFSIQSDDASSSVLIHGSISVHGADGKGGTIAVTAGRVVLEGAMLDASGPSSGGAILVGGDLHGGGSLAHAQFVTVDAASVLRADALSAGHGGKVVVWSDQLTTFAGQVSARGGATGGDGGTLEVSGRELLDFRGLGNASAPHGHAGSLLLDPKNITVDSAAAQGAAVTTVAFGDQTGQSVSLNPSSLTDTLNTGTAVTLQASNDLTVTSAITANNPSGAGGALTLQAGRSLLLNASITTDDGTLTLVANETAANGVVNADRDPGAAVITMASGVALNAGAGTMTITTGSGAGLTNSTSGDLTLRDITAGALSVTNQGPTAGTTLNLLGAVNTTGASSFAADAVTINTGAGSVNAGAVTLKPFTAGRAIDLGTKTAGTLGLTNAELGKITAGLLQIGDASSGAFTVSAALTPTSALSLTTGAGFAFNQSVTMALNKSLTAAAASAVSGTITLPNATSTLAASGTGAVALTAARSITLSSGSSITTVDGSLSLSANQQVTPATGSIVGIGLSSAVVQVTGSGSLTVLGKGGDGAASQIGVSLSASRIQGGTSGLVSVQGTGGPTSGFVNHGVVLSGSTSVITSSGANVQVTGVAGGTGTSGTNYGVYVTGGQITAGGTGSVTVQGTGGGGSSSHQKGVVVSGSTSAITSSGGNVQVTGQGSGTGSTFFNYGVTVDTSGVISAGGSGTVLVQGTGGGGTNDGVYVTGATITSSGGNVQVTGLGGSAGQDSGVSVGTGGKITAGGSGLVAVQGTGGANSFGNSGVSVGGMITSSGGNVSVTGTGGGNGTGSQNTGVVVGSGQITAGGSGTVTVQGTGGGGSGGNSDGVDLYGSSSTPGTITSGGGAVKITAFAGSGSGSFGLLSGYGGATFGKVTTAANGGTLTLLVNNFSFMSDTVVSTAANGTINLVPATAGTAIILGNKGAGLGISAADFGLFSTGTLNIGDATSGAISTLAAISPAMNLSLATNSTITLGHGITMAANKSLTASAPGTISVTAGNIAATGTGSLSFTSGRNIALSGSGASMKTVDGALSLTANQQASPASGTFAGISLGTGYVVQSTGAGAVSLLGKGGDSGTTSYGIDVAGGARLTGGSGLLDVRGTGGASTGGSTFGVHLTGAGSAIGSTGGNVQITGQGGGTLASTGFYNDGLYLETNATISAGGSGSVTIQGTSGNTAGASNVGILVAAGTSITTSGGPLTLTGTSTGTAQGSNSGLFVTGTITPGGTGQLTITGTGGPSAATSNTGIFLGPAGVLSSAGGNILITGQGGAGTGTGNTGFYMNSNGTVSAGGSGSVTIMGTGGGGTSANYGVDLHGFTGAVGLVTSSGGPVQIIGVGGAGTASFGIFKGTFMTLGSAASGGNVTLVADTMSLATDMAIATPSTGSVTLRPFTVGTPIYTGASTPAGSLGFSSAQLAAISTGTLQLGDASSGAITDSAALTPAYHLSLTTGGSLTISAGITMAANKSLTANALSTLSVTAGNLTATGTGAISLTSARNISVSGTETISTVDGNLSLSANQQATPTSGTFSGLTLTGPTLQVTGAGAVSLIGKGGDSGSNNRGIEILSGARVIGGSGLADVRGTGGPGSGSANVGVFLSATGSAVTSTGGNVQVTGQGGGVGTGLSDYGVQLLAGSVISAGGSGSVTVQGTGANTSGGSDYGVYVLGTITSSGGNVSVTGRGIATGGNSNYGVALQATGLVTAGGPGNVSVSGTGGNGSGGFEIGVSVATGATVTSGGGSVQVTGQGGGTGGSDFGVYLPANGTISAGGSGSVSITGTGGGGTSSNYGVYLQGSSGTEALITSSGGPVQITGIGGTGTSAFGINKGTFSSISTATSGGSITLIADTVSLSTDRLIATQSAGTVSLHPFTAGTPIYAGASAPAGSLGVTPTQLAAISTGTLLLGDANSGAITIATALTPASSLTLATGGGINFGAGLTLPVNKSLTANAAGTISITAGDLAATGTGAISLTSVRNISISGAGTISTVDGALSLSANQQATPTGGAFVGLSMSGYTLQVTGAGALSLFARGGDSGPIAEGIIITSGGKVLGGTGLVDLRGTGGISSSSGANGGFLLGGVGSGTVVTSSGGNVQVTAVGGGAGATDTNVGFSIAGGATLSAGGSGSVTVQGTGGNTTGGSNVGLQVAGTITSGGGNVSLTGTSPAAGLGNNYGVSVATGGLVTAGGLGQVTVSGTSGLAGGSGFEIGVSVGSGATVTSGGGNVQITGLSRATAGISNYGFSLQPNGTVSAGGSGSLTIMGTGGAGLSNDGVHLAGSTGATALVTSSGGPIQLTGIAGAGSSAFGINKDTFSSISTASAGGNITLIADTMSLATDVAIATQAAGTVTLRPLTAGKAIQVGSSIAAGTFGFTPAQLAAFATGTLQLGDATSGTITVGAALTPAYNLALSTSGGITFSAGVTLAAGKNLTANATGTISATAGSLAATGTGGISLTSGRNIALSGGGSLSAVDGAIALSANQQATPATGTFDGIKINGNYTVQSTGAGTISVLGKSGSTGSSTSGIHLSGSKILGGAGAVDLQGTGVASGSSTVGIYIDSLGTTGTVVSSTGGNVKLTGVGGGAGTATDNYGVSVAVEAVVMAGGSGSLTVQGTGGNTAGNGNAGVATLGAITSSGGPVSVTGVGRGTSGVDFGVAVTTFGSVTAGGLGTVTISGTGGSGTDSEVGVYLFDGTITSAGGNVLIVGHGGGSMGSNHGIDVEGGTVSAGGTGSLTFQGTGGGASGGNANMGFVATGFDTTSIASSGPLQITGIAGPGAASFGIRTEFESPIGSTTSGGNVTLLADTMDLETGVQTPASGTITLRPLTAGTPIYLGFGAPAGSLGLSGSQLDSFSTGTLLLGDANSGSITDFDVMAPGFHLALTTGGGINFGSFVAMAANKNLTATAAGAIAVSANLSATGTGAISLTTATGISVGAGKSITTVDGNLTLSANQQATPTAGTFIGINLAGTGSVVQATGAGNVSLLGKGGNSGTNDFGVQVPAGAKVQGGTTGSLLIQGTGGASSGGSAFGVNIGGAGALVTSSGGPVQVVGQGGGAGTVTVSYGVALNAGGTITAGGTGSVTVQGTGGNFGSTNVGVLVYPVNAKITSSGGNVVVIGQGGGGAGSTFNHGILLTGAQITAGGLGTVTVQGTGGVGNLSYGVTFEGSSSSFGVITSGGGAVQVTATAGTTTPVGLHVGDTNFGTFGTITTAANGGNLTLISDGMAFTTEAIISAGAGGTVTLRPKTAGTLINLGGTDGGRLALAASELNVISAGTVQIGDAASGAITVSAAVTPNFNLSMTTGAGMTISAAVTMGLNKNLTGTAAGQISFSGSNGALAAGGTGAISLTTARGINFTGGGITTVDGDLTLSANQQATPTSGSFTGISLSNATVQATGSGRVSLAGRGGDASFSNQDGVQLITNAVVRSGTGTVTVQGTGGAGPLGGNWGVVTSSGGTITSGGGNVLVVGQGGGTNGLNYGVGVVSGGLISAGGLGTVTVQGTGGVNDGSGNVGVIMYGIGGTQTITSSGGNVQVTGLGGGSGSSTGNSGVSLQGGATITAGPGGAVTVSGTGGGSAGSSNSGVVLAGSSASLPASISSGGGPVTVTGAIGSGTSAVGVTLGTFSTVTTAANGGNVTLVGDSISLSSSSNIATPAVGTATLKPLTPGTLISLGGNDAAGTLGLSAAEIAVISTGTLQVGDANSGAISTAAALTPAISLSLTTGSTITFSQGIAMAADKSFTANAPSTISVTAGNLTAAGTGGISLTGARDITLGGGGFLTTVDGAITVSANQQASPASGTFDGIHLTGSLTVQSTGTGAISLLGKGGNSGLATTGINITGGAKIIGGSGLLDIEGTGGASSGGSTVGISISTAGTSVTSTGGNVQVTGWGGGAGSSGTNHGVVVLTGAVVSAGGSGSVAVQGTGGSTTGSGNVGVYVMGSITSAGGNVAVNGHGMGTGGVDYGVYVTGGGLVTAGGAGQVSVSGTGGNSANSESGVLVNTNGTITSAGGNVQVTGQGGGTASFNNGVSIQSGTVTAGGSGSVTVVGTGGGGSTGSGNIGVFMQGVPGSPAVLSSAGPLQITGFGGAGAFGYGFSKGSTSTIGSVSGGNITLIADTVSMATDTAITTQPSGSVTLRQNTAGTAISIAAGVTAGSLSFIPSQLAAISTGTVQVGDANSGTITISSAISPGYHLALTTGGSLSVLAGVSMAAGKNLSAIAPGAISVSNATLAASGTGAISLTTAHSITLSGTGGITTVDGALSLSANQQAVPSTGAFGGIFITGETVQSTGSGAVSLVGKGGDSSTGAFGVRISGNGKVIGGTGLTDVRGTGGVSSAGGIEGVSINGVGSSITSTGGNVQVTGQGGGAGASIINYGVYVAAGGVLSAGGSGSVTVQGTSGATSGGSNPGVVVSGTVTSGGGNVSLTGTSLGVGSGSNFGVSVAGLVTAGGAGRVSVSGTGGNSSGTLDVGVSVATGGTITSGGGNVQITGQGGGGTGGGNAGFYLHSNGTVKAGGTGSVTISGTGGSGGTGNHGIDLLGNAGAIPLITSSGGSVQLTGVAGAGGASSAAIFKGPFANITTAASGGNLTLVGDTLNLATTPALATQATGTVTLSPLTAGTPITISSNDPTGIFGFSAPQLAAISTGTLQLGDANSGAITLATALTPAYHLALTTGAGITVSVGITLAANKNLTATAVGTIGFGAAGSIVAGTGIVALQAGAVSTSDNGVKITADQLSIVAGGGIGSALTPLGFAVTTLTTDSSAGNGDQYLRGSATVGAAGLNAGSGTITFFDNTFTLGGNDRLADLSKLKLNNATLALGTFSDTVAGVSLLSGAITGSGTLTSASAFDLQSGSVSANLGGNVGVSKTTTGTVVLGGANSYTGATTVAAGMLNVQNALALGTTAGGTTVSAGASLQIQGGVSLAEAITVSGTGALESVSGQNAVTGLVTLAGATTISVDANAGLALAGGIADTTSGASDLTLAIATGGSATLTGGVGGAVPLKSFTSTGAGVLKVGGSITTVASSTTFGTPVQLVADTTINSAAGIAWQSAAALDGDGAGPWTLTLNADTDAAGSDGLVTFGASVGATAPLKTVAFGSKVIGITLAGAQFNTTAAQAFPVAVTLGASESMTTAGDVSFAGTVNGGFALAVHSSGTTSFAKTVGNTAALTSLSTDAGGTASLSANVTTTGAQSYGGNLIIAAASTLTTTNGAVTIGGATTLNGDLIVNARSITFNGAIDGGKTLTAYSADGTIFGAAIGATTPLTGLTTNAGGTTILAGNVTTTGAQSYGDTTVQAASLLATTNSQVTFGALLLGADLTVNAGTGNISFTRTVDGPGALVANSHGTTTFSGLIGGKSALGSLTTDAGGTTILPANVITTGAQIYGDNTTTAGILSTSNRAIFFGGTTTLNGNLTVNAGSGDVTFAGAVTGLNFALNVNSTGSTLFGGPVGTVAAQLLSLTTDAGGSTTLSADIVTLNAQTYGDDLTVAAATKLSVFLGGVHVAGNITLNADLELSKGGHTLSGTIDGAHVLRLPNTRPFLGGPSVTGFVSLGGSVGSLVPLSAIDAHVGVGFAGGTVSTTGDQNYAGGISVGASTSLVSTNNGLISISGGSSSAAGAALTITTGAAGRVKFGGLGAPFSFDSLDVNGPAPIDLNGAMISIRDQSYAGPVNLTGAALLSSALGAVRLHKIDGANNLTISAYSGGITLDDRIGSTTPLSHLTLTSPTNPITVNTDLIQLTGGLQITGGVTLGQSLVINNTTGGEVRLAALNAATDGGQGLTVSSGGASTVSFGTAVGNVHPLASLTLTGAAPISLAGDVTTTGTQSYAGAVTLAGSATLSTTDANFAFGSTIDGTTPNTQSLVLRAGAGALTFGGAIGATVPLANFTTESGAAALALPAITLGGNLSVTAGGAISQTGPHVIAGSATYIGTGIDLSQAGNDFTGVLTLASTTAAPTTVQTANALTLAAASFGGSLTATALHGELKIDGRIDYNGQLNLTAAGAEKAIIVSADVLNAGSGNVTLKATGDIVVRNGAALVTNGSLLALVADSEESHSGAILIEGGSIVENHGGAVQLGGDDTKAPAYGSGAVYDGITLNSGVTILGDVRAGGGFTYVNGQGKTDAAPQDGHNFGVLIDGHGSVTSTGAGGITIFALAGPGSAAFAMTNLYGTGTPRLGDDGSETYTGSIAMYLQEADAFTDPFTLRGAVIHSHGALFLNPYLSSVGIAGAAGTMNLSTAELAQFADGFSSIQISAGGPLASNAVTFTDPVILDGTSIDLLGTVSAGADPVSLDAGTGVITIEQAATFTVKAAGVIADASMLHFRGGTLELGAFNETVGGVQLFGGTINAAGGTLTSATTFELLQGAIHASLAGTNAGVGVLKYDDFTVSLSAPSTYAGGTTIRAGTLEFSHPRALGTGLVTLGDADTGSDTTALLATGIMNDSDLTGGSHGQFNNDLYVAPYGTGKTIIGTAAFDASTGTWVGLHDRSTTFAGHLTLTKATTLQGGNSDRTSFSGVVAGSTVAVEGGARVVLSNSGDTFSSSFTVAGAGTTLQVEGNGDALFTATNVDIGQGATLALAASALHNVSLRSLSGAGTVGSALAGTPQSLYLSDPHGAGNFAGTITDGASPVSLLKFGAGTQTLSGLNTYTGGTIVKEGKLALVSTSTNNNLASSPDLTVVSGATLDVTGLDHGAVLDTLVLASGQTLHGSGAIAGRLQTTAASTLAPASSAPALFSTGDLALSAGSTFSATIDHTAVSLDGQVNVKGTVSLGDATLHLGGALGASSHQRIVLIQNDGTDPVAGTFHGLGEGALVPLNGVNYILSYHGGDGNDVTLEQDRSIYAVAAGVTTAGAYGLPVVNVYNSATGVEIFSITAYETKLREGIRVAIADMNGDGYDDIITTTATGTGRLRVFDGLTGKRFTSGPFANELAVFDGKTDQGAFVGAGDLTGDGRADLIVGSALGGGKVRVFDGVTGAALTFSTGQTFLQPFGKTFKGGIRVAAGDFNGDRVSDLALGENYYGAKVAVYDGTTLFATPAAPVAPLASPLLSFDFGPKNLRTGVNIAVGDFDHNGLADLLVGSNAGPTYVQTYSGILKDSAGLPQKIGTPIYPFDKSPLQHLYTLGVRVASFDVNGDGIADIIAASSGQAKSVVNIYSGADHSLLRTFAAFPALPNSALFVAASATL